MSDAQNQGEPTMEEILASIRKIINEDGTPADAEAPADDASADSAAADSADAEEAPPLEEAPAPEEPAAEEASEEPGDDEDVLDLTRMVGEDGEVIDLNADKAGMEVSAEPEEVVAEEPAIVAEDPLGAFDNEADDEGEIPDLVAVDQEPEESPGDTERGLVSDQTRAAATATLVGLADAAGPRDGSSLNDSKTLEDLVRESLEPYLKAWLDQNLPALVERIVREEIQKMVRRAEYR